MGITIIDAILLLLVGLGTGILGGMAGLGGSIIMIPAMAVLFHGRSFDDQHLYQASSMAVNVAVSIPAALRHRRSGAIRMDMFRFMLPATLVMIAVGVVVSNRIDGHLLEKLFAGFVAAVAVQMLWSAARRQPELDDEHARVDRVRGGIVGGVMGFFAGLLGVGGGVVAVPLARVLCRLPLRRCIASTAAVMGLTSAVGAVMKIGTLGEHGHGWAEAIVLAGLLAPTAMVGGYIGGGLTHSLPLVWVRSVLATMLLAASAKMAGVW